MGQSVFASFVLLIKITIWHGSRWHGSRWHGSQCAVCGHGLKTPKRVNRFSLTRQKNQVLTSKAEVEGWSESFLMMF
jgi:hypothetical protein